MNEQPDNYILLENAIGSIQASDDQADQLDEITQLLAEGEFHTLVDGYNVCKCVDGRSGGDGLYPNTAGGTISLMVADDLTTRRITGSAVETAEAFRAIVAHLESHEQLVGGHGDDHAHNDASGCGANDKLPQIYEFIAESGDMLRDMAEKLGVVVTNDMHELIVTSATERAEFSSGAEVAAVLQEDENRHYETLVGAHKEVAAVINLLPDTTFNREDFSRSFGDAYQAFNIDAWAFEEAVAQISESPEEVSAKLAAMVYYNLATAHVLCGPEMRVIVLS